MSEDPIRRFIVEHPDLVTELAAEWLVKASPERRRLVEHEAVRTHKIRPISTRRYYPGRHRVELVANGRTLASGEFELEM